MRIAILWFLVVCTELAYGQYPVKFGDRFGYIDSTGKMVCEGRFSVATRFAEGYAAVQVGGKSRWFIIDASMKVAIPYGYDSVGYFSEGRCPVLMNGTWMYINKQGLFTTAEDLEQAGSFRNGMARVCRKGSCYLIDTAGKRLTPEYRDISLPEDSVFAALPTGSTYWLLLHLSGDTLLNDSFSYLSAPSGKVVMAIRKGGYRYLDLQGNTLFGRTYLEATPFGSQYACVREDRDWFLMDRKGKLNKRIRLKAAVVLDSPLNKAQNYNGKWGYLSRNGTWIYLEE